LLIGREFLDRSGRLFFDDQARLRIVAYGFGESFMDGASRQDLGGVLVILDRWLLTESWRGNGHRAAHDGNAHGSPEGEMVEFHSEVLWRSGFMAKISSHAGVPHFQPKRLQERCNRSSSGILTPIF
jgi:hypothetical protein